MVKQLRTRAWLARMNVAGLFEPAGSSTSRGPDELAAELDTNHLGTTPHARAL
jgi:hypothetical protein